MRERSQPKVCNMDDRDGRVARSDQVCPTPESHTLWPMTRDSEGFSAERITDHRDGDDLVTAGLGLDGLRASVPPLFSDPSAPTASELRRRAIWSNWRGIADLSPDGGFGRVYGSVETVPGREYSAFARVPGARHPHRVLAQIPDAFDRIRRCVLVAPSSGSRGIYGAIAIAGAWGLPKGCAVAYTDKGCGTDYFDLDAGVGVRADGTLAAPGEDELAFVADVVVGARGVAFKHAHSRDNPEASWGLHVLQAAEFALRALDAAFPEDAPFTFENTRIIAVGLSNGGGAVLRAAELEGPWLDAVVAAEPNIYVEAGGRPLYDYATEAALLMPCALLALDDLPQPPWLAEAAPEWRRRCAALRDADVLRAANGDDSPAGLARDALARLQSSGWTESALRAGALSVGLDLWRTLAAAYASAYGRFAAGTHPCGVVWSALDIDGAAREASAFERAVWWSDASGIPPGAGVGIADPIAEFDPAVRTLRGLRVLWTGDLADSERVRAGIAETRAGRPQRDVPILVVHGIDDGLVPIAFSSEPYVEQARAAGCDIRFWRLRNVQHFDAFLGFPDYAARYLPILAYVYAALERTLSALEGEGAWPEDASIAAVPRAGRPLTREHLALPQAGPAV